MVLLNFINENLCLSQENPCQHPVIILKDVSADDIVSLLSYMYQGEVFIEESKLSSFLHTAALLQVKGLTGVTQQVMKVLRLLHLKYYRNEKQIPIYHR